MENDHLVMGCRVHHGHNLTHLRKERGIKQEAMASKLNMSQQTISRHESMPVIEDKILQQYAEALEIPLETIKNMKEELPSIFIENNTFEHNAKVSNIIGNHDVEDNSTNTFDPIEKIIQLSDEKSQLYERMLKLEQEKNEALEKRLSALELRL